MQLNDLTTDDAVLAELGQRLAGQRIERGESVQLTSLIRLLRSLELLPALDAALPEAVVSPLAELERAQRPVRRRARRTNDADDTSAEAWTWGDDEPRRPA